MKKRNERVLEVFFLGVGLAIAMVLISKVCFELSYDGFYKDVDRIYSIRTGYERQGESKDFGQVSGGVAPGFKQEIPGVLEDTRYTSVFNSSIFYDKDGNKLTAEHIVTDTSFFKIFDRPFLAGDPQKALESWNGDIAVSRSFAEKLGGVQEAIGKVLSNADAPTVKLNVCGVYEDFPKNGSIQADIILSIDVMGKGSTDNWLGNDRYLGFVKLAPGVDPLSLKPAIRKMQEAHQPMEEMEKNGTKLWYYLDGFADQHRTLPEVRNLVLILSIVSLLLLLISVLNYLLVAIGDVIRRAKEVGVRKCYGAEARNIYGLLLKDTAVTLGLSLVLAALLILSFRGPIESLTDVSVKDLVTPLSGLIIIGIIFIVFVTSALIPAHMFMNIPVSSAFRGYKENKRRWKLTLLAFQFAISAVLLSLVLIVSAQYRKALNNDLGYDSRNLVYATFPSYGQDKMNEIAQSLRQLPEVKAAELTYVLPFWTASGNNIYLPGDSRELFNVADEYGSSEGFFKMMGFRLLEGTEPKGPKDVAVSKSFVERMNKLADWRDGAVGKSLVITEHSNGDKDVFTICGVYADYLIGSITKDEMDERPSIRFCWNKSFFQADTTAASAGSRNSYDWSSTMQTLVVKLDEVTPESKAKVLAVIKEAAPDSDPELESYSESLKDQYKGTLQMKRTYQIGTLFALLLAIVGLIGYVRDENYRRSSEIAVRKVNGAQSREIVRMLVLDVLKIAVAGVIIGDLAAWFIAHLWLEQFAVKVSLSPWFFIAADLAVLVIIVATVVFNSFRIAFTNPSESLKNE